MASEAAAGTLVICRAAVYMQHMVGFAAAGNVQLLRFCLVAGAPTNHRNSVSEGHNNLQHSPATGLLASQQLTTGGV